MNKIIKLINFQWKNSKKYLQKNQLTMKKRKNCEIINRDLKKNEKIINSIYPQYG